MDSLSTVASAHARIHASRGSLYGQSAPPNASFHNDILPYSNPPPPSRAAEETCRRTRGLRYAWCTSCAILEPCQACSNTRIEAEKSSIGDPSNRLHSACNTDGCYWSCMIVSSISRFHLPTTMLWQNALVPKKECMIRDYPCHNARPFASMHRKMIMHSS